MSASRRVPRLLSRCTQLALRASRILPARFAFWLGGVLGDAFARLPGRETRRCRAHLRIAFPDRDAAFIDRTTRAAFRHVGRVGLWTLATWHRSGQQLRRGVGVEGGADVRALMRSAQRGEPTLGFTGHFGNWELLARIGATFLPITAIGRELRSPLADDLVRGLRSRDGARTIYQHEGIPAMLRELRAGRVLAALIDQDIPRLAGVFVPWFGRLAHTPAGPAGLVLMSGAAAQPIFCYHCGGPWRGRFVFHAGPRRHFARPPAGPQREAAVREITAWITAYEEALVRRHPEQWVWWHLRWRTRPPTHPASPEKP